MRRIITLALFLFIVFQASSQCTFSDPIPVIACGTGLPLANGVTINTGQTYFFDGIAGSFSNITINGGTLLLCGISTITNVNFNSGQVLINPGANVTFNGSFNASSDYNFFNYGTIVFNQQVVVQGTNTIVYNATDATITVSDNLSIINSGLLVNNGTITVENVIINSGAEICLGPSSSSEGISFTNNETNVVTVPTGTACVSYSSSFTGNNPVTASPNLRICQQTGASAPVPVVIGAAIVTANCTSCPTLLASLPLKLISFRGKLVEGQAEMEWATASEENVRVFVIERRRNGQNFEAVGEVPARNHPSTYKFTTPVGSDSYFRLKMVDLDGRFTYSATIRLRSIPDNIHVAVLANPVTRSYAELTITAGRSQKGELMLIDNLGRLVKRIVTFLVKGSNSLLFDLNGVQGGQYYLSFISDLEKSKPVPLIKH